jgi:ABC-type polysaccharide/polyol phosphate export permease
MSSITAIANSRELINNLTLRELRSRYKRSVLGWTWSLLNPLATVAIYSIVFSKVLRVEIEPGDPSGLHNFPIWLLCALLSWNFFANGINGAMGTLVGNAGLIKKVYFPRENLVIANSLSMLVTLLVEMLVLCVILVAMGNMVFIWLPYVALIVAFQTLFVTGVSLVLSVLNVYFRDLQYLISILLQALFYMTPIIYPPSLVRERAGGTVEFLYGCNPLMRFVEAYRNLLFDLRAPSAGTVAYLAIVSVVTLVIGHAVFNRFEGRLAEEL